MNTRRSSPGFSLIELLISASVAGLSALILGQGMVNWQGSQSKVQSLNQLGALESNLRLFFNQGVRCAEFIANNSGVFSGLGASPSGSIPMNTVNLGSFGTLALGSKIPGGSAVLSEISFAYQVLMTLPGSTQIFAGRLNLIYKEGGSQRDFSIPIQFFRVAGSWSCNAPLDTSATNLKVLCQFWGGGTWNETTKKCERGFCAELGLAVSGSSKCETNLAACSSGTYWSGVEAASSAQQWKNSCSKLTPAQAASRQCGATAGGLLGLPLSGSKPVCEVEPAACGWTQWSACAPSACWDGQGPLPPALQARECVYKFNGVSSCDVSSCGGGATTRACSLASTDYPICPSAGVCGTANKVIYTTAPSKPAELCAKGTPSAVTATKANTGPLIYYDKRNQKRVNYAGVPFDTAPWSWTCQGPGGGTSISCATAPTPPRCYMATFNQPAAARRAPCYEQTAGFATLTMCKTAWASRSASCAPSPDESACTAIQVGDPREPICVSNPVDGACGTANGTVVKTAPTQQAELCAAGQPSVVNGTGPWDWSCQGIFGGGTVSCRANSDCWGGGTYEPAGSQFKITQRFGSCKYPIGKIVSRLELDQACTLHLTTCALLVDNRQPNFVGFRCIRK